MTEPSPAIAHAGLPAWGWMWILAGAIFAGAKWLTWRPFASRMNGSAMLIYWLGWPGLDAAPFAVGPGRKHFAPWTEWAIALLKPALGLVLVRIGAGEVAAGRETTGGVIGFAGLLFCLHFGLFHLLSLAWNAAGYRVQPIMHAPCLAESVAEFWGRRWNRAFRDMSQQLIVRPCRALFGRRGLMFAVFAVSGLLHEAVISVPAGGGYGGPTVYFLIQAAGMAIQRSAGIRRHGFERGFRGWLLTAAFVLAPLPLLFHPSFLRNVVAPFVEFIGSTL